MLTRIITQIRGRISLMITKVESKNPHVLLENAKIDLRDLRKQNNTLLTDVLTVSERLRRQITVLKETSASLEASINSAVHNSQTELAEEQALIFEETNKELKDKESELEVNEQTYRELVETSRIQEKKYAREIEQLSNLVCKAEAEEAKALITESILQTPSAYSLNNLEVNKSNLQNAINSQIDRSKARIKRARDSTHPSVLKQEDAVLKNRQSEALKRFFSKA